MKVWRCLDGRQVDVPLQSHSRVQLPNKERLVASGSLSFRKSSHGDLCSRLRIKQSLCNLSQTSEHRHALPCTPTQVQYRKLLLQDFLCSSMHNLARYILQLAHCHRKEAQSQDGRVLGKYNSLNIPATAKPSSSPLTLPSLYAHSPTSFSLSLLLSAH